MSYPVFYPEAGDTLPIFFDTFDGGTGASITMTGLAVTDIEIYQDGVATTRASENGYALLDTDGINFDSLTGIHGISINLSDNSDDGFYAVGSWYTVVISTITVDGQTVSFIAASFRILSLTRGMAGTALPDAAADAASGLPISDAGGLNMDQIGSDTAAIDAIAWYPKYNGPRGLGVYLNDAAGNTNTTNGTDGTVNNPVSTIAAAKTIADSLSLDRIYLVVHADITLAATMEDYEFVGIGEATANIVNLGSQDVDRSAFYNLTIEGTQGGTGRIYAERCALQDPGAGATTLHIFAKACGIMDTIEVDTSADNVFDQCYSLVAGASAPIIVATGASGTIAIRHFSGGIELSALSASHNISVETDGQVIFTADCNVNATVALRGNMTITDNTAGMASLTTDAVYDKRSDIAAILVDTAEIGTAGAGLTDLGGMSDGMKAEVESEVNDALDTAISELAQAAPSATPTIRTGIMLPYMALRNKLNVTTSGADELQVHNDDGTVIATKALTDDGDDYSEAEMIAGP